MQMQPKELPFGASDLTGLSERLLTSHHKNNYGGAVRRLNALRDQLSGLDWSTAPSFMVNGLKREELVAANSAFLHELYFSSLGGDGLLPASGLSIALSRDFGSVESWRGEFMALGKALAGGSGWVMTSWSTRESRLVNHWSADHTHMLAGATPVLVLDMYEHAYHMDYGADAAAYVDAFMTNIDWQTVHRRYGAAVEADATAAGVAITARDSAAQVVDVRRRETFDESPDMLVDAIYRDPASTGQWASSLDKSRPVLVYCAHGQDIGRSTALALRARGLDAYCLLGGIEAWREAGQPVSQKMDAIRGHGDPAPHP